MDEQQGAIVGPKKKESDQMFQTDALITFVPAINKHNEDVACSKCGEKLRYWRQFGTTIVENVLERYPGLGLISSTNNEVRNASYRAFMYERHGVLGKGNRVQVPRCALEGIGSI